MLIESNDQLVSSGINSESTTLRAQVQEVLRSAILEGRFKAGQKLVERELCELTGASRSILREALINLEASGLIERQSYRGFSVTRIGPRKVKEIFELRAPLETLAAELFTERASDQEIESISEIMAEMEACIATSDLARLRAAKERYYDVLFTGCRNIEIRKALENVIDRIHYLRSQLISDAERRDQSLIEMRRLTSALINRDQLATRQACMDHILSARDAVLRQMAQAQSNS